MKANQENAPDQKPDRKRGPAALIYDIDAPDSLISPHDFQVRQDRLAKFQRRAAHPKERPNYRHAERLWLIDFLLQMQTDEKTVDCMVACVKADSRYGSKLGYDTPKLDQALMILT